MNENNEWNIWMKIKMLKKNWKKWKYRRDVCEWKCKKINEKVKYSIKWIFSSLKTLKKGKLLHVIFMFWNHKSVSCWAELELPTKIVRRQGRRRPPQLTIADLTFLRLWFLIDEKSEYHVSSARNFNYHLYFWKQILLLGKLYGVENLSSALC